MTLLAGYEARPAEQIPTNEELAATTAQQAPALLHVAHVRDVFERSSFGTDVAEGLQAKASEYRGQQQAAQTVSDGLDSVIELYKSQLREEKERIDEDTEQHREIRHTAEWITENLQSLTTAVLVYMDIAAHGATRAYEAYYEAKEASIRDMAELDRIAGERTRLLQNIAYDEEIEKQLLQIMGEDTPATDASSQPEADATATATRCDLAGEVTESAETEQPVSVQPPENRRAANPIVPPEMSAWNGNLWEVQDRLATQRDRLVTLQREYDEQAAVLTATNRRIQDRQQDFSSIISTMFKTQEVGLRLLQEYTTLHRDIQQLEYIFYKNINTEEAKKVFARYYQFVDYVRKKTVVAHFADFTTFLDKSGFVDREEQKARGQHYADDPSIKPLKPGLDITDETHEKHILRVEVLKKLSEVTATFTALQRLHRKPLEGEDFSAPVFAITLAETERLHDVIDTSHASRITQAEEDTESRIRPANAMRKLAQGAVRRFSACATQLETTLQYVQNHSDLLPPEEERLTKLAEQLTETEILHARLQKLTGLIGAYSLLTEKRIEKEDGEIQAAVKAQADSAASQLRTAQETMFDESAAWMWDERNYGAVHGTDVAADASRRKVFQELHLGELRARKRRYGVDEREAGARARHEDTVLADNLAAITKAHQEIAELLVYTDELLAEQTPEAEREVATARKWLQEHEAEFMPAEQSTTQEIVAVLEPMPHSSRLQILNEQVISRRDIPLIFGRVVRFAGMALRGVAVSLTPPATEIMLGVNAPDDRLLTTTPHNGGEL